MARFYGTVGFAVTVEEPFGVSKDVVVGRKYYGDVLRASRKLENGELANSDISVSNSISILADDYALANIRNIRYVEWKGVNWVAPSVEERGHRLILELGGVYRGLVPEA